MLRELRTVSFPGVRLPGCFIWRINCIVRELIRQCRSNVRGFSRGMIPTLQPRSLSLCWKKWRPNNLAPQENDPWADGNEFHMGDHEIRR